jgi:hypothetical protein
MADLATTTLLSLVRFGFGFAHVVAIESILLPAAGFERCRYLQSTQQQNEQICRVRHFP